MTDCRSVDRDMPPINVLAANTLPDCEKVFEMKKSLDVWLATGKPCEVRVTCDPRYVSVSDLLDIARDVAALGVRDFAVQRYIPHFEEPDNTTTAQQRNAFFEDEKARKEIDSLFEHVCWRD